MLRRPVVTDFHVVDATKCVACVTHPEAVTELVFFLLPGASLPAGSSACLYYSVDGTQWTLLGSVDVAKPSGVFRTPWHSHLNAITQIQLGVSRSVSPRNREPAERKIWDSAPNGKSQPLPRARRG